MKNLAAANSAILLGRGVEESKNDDEVIGYKLGIASEARVNAMANYYYNHRRSFESRDSIIVASGGYARLAGNQIAPPLNQREGAKMADLLIQRGVPHKLIQVELESGSTTENYERTIAEGFFDGRQFDAHNPLLVVAGKPHGKHRGVPLARAAFGIDDHAGVGLIIAESETPKTRMMEYVLGLVLAQSIQEVQPEAFSAGDMAEVGMHFEQSVRSPLAVAHAGLAQVIPALSRKPPLAT